MKYLCSAFEAASLADEQSGGKAKNLLTLTLHDYPVPPWWLIPTAITQKIVADESVNGLLDWLREASLTQAALTARAEKTAEAIRQHINALPLPAGLAQALKDLDGSDPERLWAVRSSCSDEDSAGNSFAGQMDTLLFRRGYQQLYDAVRTVMASAYSARALLYRLHNQLPLSEIRSAVIIQHMVEGDVSGVLFTAHPVTGCRQAMLVSAGWGCGEGMVSGQCDTDEFTVPLHGEKIMRQLGEKSTAVVFDRQTGSGTLEVSLDREKAKAATLKKSELLTLRDMGAAIARLCRCPQDIEWTIKEGKIYLLQTRPITRLPKDEACPTDSLVCDNANIQESYCGITTPLTFSFARAAYSLVYEQTLQLVGCAASDIERRKAITDNMLSLVRGRVYYNIQNWYRALQFLPMFNVNKADMEAMMGLEDPVDIVQTRTLSWREKAAKFFSLLRVAPRLHYALLTLDRRIARFLQQYEQAEACIDRRNLHTLSPSQLIRLLKYLDERLLARWTTPIVNDFYVANCNGKVQRALQRPGTENAAQLKSDLLSDQDHLASTEPTKKLLAMSDYLRDRPALAAQLVNGSGTHLLASLKQADPTFYQQCLDYIERYGDRVVGELKLETVTLRQNPDFLFSVLRNYLHAEAPAQRPPQSLRVKAEKQVFQLIEAQQGARRLRHFKKHLASLRKAIRDRESLRFIRTKTFGLYRDIYLALGNQLALEGVLASPRDIFWLTREEIYSGEEGTAIQTNLRSLTAQRRAEYQDYQQQAEPAHHFYVRQTLFQQQAFRYPGPPAPPHNGHRLQGTGCYPGIVEAPVSIVLSPEQANDLTGKILCAVRTDPGWGPLFPGISGLLIERGSTLSHSAIVAREMGIPAIVGVSGVTRLVQEGEKVRIDGATGTVDRLAACAAAQEEPRG